MPTLAASGRAEGGLAVDAAGRVYVPDRGNQRIQVFNADGSHYLTFGSGGGGNNEFSCPAGVAISPANGDIFVVDQCNQRIQVYTSAWVYRMTLGVLGQTGTDNRHFDWPSGCGGGCQRCSIRRRSQQLSGARMHSLHHRLRLHNLRRRNWRVRRRLRTLEPCRSRRGPTWASRRSRCVELPYPGLRRQRRLSYYYRRPLWSRQRLYDRPKRCCGGSIRQSVCGRV